MSENPPRLDRDGNVQKDWDVNPVHLEAVAKIEAERKASAALAEEAASGVFTRARVERMLARRATVEVDGIPRSLPIVLAGTNLFLLDLSLLDLSNVNFHGASLVGANLNDCDLRGANFHGAALKDVRMNGVRADGVNFSRACLCGAVAFKSTFRAANLSECCMEGADGINVGPDAKGRAVAGEGCERANVTGVSFVHVERKS